MSLNGLDDPKVAEAYQAANAEPGGWFLLKYASRDAVKVLTRGTGGVTETRAALTQYEDKSPLYGFLLYRRRKVLIKYVPDGTSRLLQARLAVHLESVTDRFTPHDAIFSITTPDELSDSALIAACGLHTAAPSTASSGGSIRRKKLDEITEDAEEGQSGPVEAAPVVRPTTAASFKSTITGSLSKWASASPGKSVKSASSTTEGPSSTQEPESSVSDAREEGKEFNHDHYRESLKQYDPLFEDGPDPRFSSQTARPAMADIYAEIYEKYNKPKVKLGPRPRPSMDGKRPHTAGSPAPNSARVSTLPTGLRIGNRKTEPKRPKSRDSSVVPSIAFPPPPPVPSVPEIPFSSMVPPGSPISVRSMPASSYVYTPKTPSMTPEKQRLMKALELRKKQMKAQREKEEQATKENQDVAADAGGNAEEVSQETANAGPGQADARKNEVQQEDISKGESTQEEVIESTLELPHDSGDDSSSNNVEVDDQQSAASACSPTSAQTQPSSNAPSTRPSSLSDHGDEDVAHQKSDSGVAQSAISVTEGDDVAASTPARQERESVESTPTIVPEDMAVPQLVEPAPQPPTEEAADAKLPEVVDEFAARRKKRESMILGPSGDDDNRIGRTRTRESVLYVPAKDGSRESSAHSAVSRRRSKRESMVLAAPPKRNSFLESKEKRRPVEPIQIHLSAAENSEGEYESDDSFMQELKTAKVEEAKPVSVSKSPISPFFPRKGSVSEVNLSDRPLSARAGFLTADSHFQGQRSVSPPWLQHANTDTVVVAKKINVSSGISQRIKALAEKSNRDSTASVNSLTTPEAGTSIVAQRKSSFFSTPPSIENSPPEQRAKRFTRASFINVSKSNSTSPSPEHRMSIQPPVNALQGENNAPQIPQKPESVQVTARIVRDPRVEKPRLTVPDDMTPLELHQSPININHPRSALSNANPSPRRPEPASPLSPSSPQKDGPSVPRSSSESSWRSFGRRLSESRASSTQRSQSINSFESDGEEKREGRKEKKDSRTSKLFKRMSSISSISSLTGKKHSVSSPALVEEHHPSMLPSLKEPPSAVELGDLNIQFPDTLLWKRRWVVIDASGNLVLSPSKANELSKGITKRFHLTEFRTPYLPDQDRQELPNSVILDFLDGRTLQCACESHNGQLQALQILREAHEGWLAYGQH